MTELSDDRLAVSMVVETGGMMAVHISFGALEEYEDLPGLARSGRPRLWTLAKDAVGLDTVVFYIKRPTSSFVATGIVQDDKRVDGARYGRSALMGKIGNVELLPREVPLREARGVVPAWPYLRQPHTNITVPAEHEAAFLKALGVNHKGQSSAKPPVMAVENIQQEMRILRRSRNRRLRDKVIRDSGGTCGICDTNYSIMEPRWTSLLQAHHRRPLHETKEPVINSTRSLVAVCPTCHVLLHLGPGKVRTPSQVKKLVSGKIVGQR